MKMKNANFFQRHVEKLILGGALLIAAVLVLLYVVGNPHYAEINGQALGPVEIEERVEDMALQLDARLKSSKSPLPEMTVPPYTQDFTHRIERNVAGAPYEISLSRTGLDPKDVMPPQPPAPYDLPHPPVPQEVIAQAGYGVLGVMDNVNQQHALIQLIGEKQPQDFRFVSASATFDTEQWHERLRSASALPDQFYRGMLGVAGVYLQRQTLNPMTGEWGETTIIQPLPTQISFLPSYTYEYTDEQAEQVITFIESNQQQIARPEFPPLAGHAIWLPPFAQVELNDQERREFQELGKKMESLTTRIQRLTERMERAGERPQPDRNISRRPPEVFEPEDMFDNPAGARRGQQRAAPRDPTSEMAQQLERLQQQLYEARTRRDELMGVPAETPMGPPDEFMDPRMIEDDPRMRPNAPQPNMPQFVPPMMPNPALPPQAEGQAPPQDDGTITVWAHDLTVEPGTTYRYRVLVSVLNPLFRQTRVEDSQRQEHFNKVALGPDMSQGGEVEESPWSEPVEVDPKYYFFFVQGGQSPRVEVWHIYDGIWRSEEFSVQPGDPIGGTMEIEIDGEPRTIDMSVGAVVVDLMETAGGRGVLGGNDARLLYLAPGSNQIASRSVQQDLNSDARIRIQTQRTMQEERARQASAVQQ